MEALTRTTHSRVPTHYGYIWYICSTVFSNTPFKKHADNSQLNRHKGSQALSKIYIEDLLSGTTTMKKALQQLMGHLFRQRNQFSRGVQPAAGGLRHAAMSNPNNEGPGFLTKEGCNQNFIPPHAPHFRGLWEAAVKSVKYHLRRTLGAQIATYEELNTLLTEIEACLNSRTLCAHPNDPHLSYLSPGHFLIGEPLTQLPTIDYSNIK